MPMYIILLIFFPPFGSPTMICGLLAVICSWRLLGLMQCMIVPVSAIPVLSSKVISGVDPTELI